MGNRHRQDPAMLVSRKRSGGITRCDLFRCPACYSGFGDRAEAGNDQFFERLCEVDPVPLIG